MAQGKMHSSAFHVESAQYKYAVEHETDDCIPKSQLVNCKYFNSSTKMCSLWNSGKQRCSSHNCLKFNPSLRRQTSCEDCAFYYGQKCFCKKKPPKVQLSTKDAEYCCFYFGEDNNIRKYRYIRQCCERVFYTQIADECLKKIKSKYLIIDQFQTRLQTLRLNRQEVEYLNNKIRDKTAERTVEEKKLLECNRHLSEIGGRLKEIP